MYIANTQIITSDGTFAIGETVTGLTKADIDRMLSQGYITEKVNPKVEPEEKPKKANKSKKESSSEEVE